MATKSKTIEEYIERRVRELVGLGWSDFQITQQLSGLSERKLVVATIAAIRQKM
jgi:hypothetical protein